MNVLQMFSYPFMQRALAAGVLVSLCAALLGVPLVLKRYSMIGDGLSHVSFGALAIAVALGITPLYFSIPVVILAAFFLLRMAKPSPLEQRRRHCRRQCVGAGRRYSGDFPHHRHDHGCGQLYVRQRAGHDEGRTWRCPWCCR